VSDESSSPNRVVYAAQECSLTEDERMLVLLRDELYEGNWDDFVQDLKDRLANKPHVFDIVPASPRLQETIREHLRLIDKLRRWEATEQIDLATRLSAGSAGPASTT